MMPRTVPIYTVLTAPAYANIGAGDVLTLQQVAEFFELNTSEVAMRSAGANKVYMNVGFDDRVDTYELAVEWV
jgi:hypothetical protein